MILSPYQKNSILTRRAKRERVTSYRHFPKFRALVEVLEPAIKDFENQGYEVEGSQDFCSLHDEIQQFLREAKRIAKIEGSMGFRGVEMSPEAAKDLRAHLDAHSKSATATPPSASSP